MAAPTNAEIAERRGVFRELVAHFGTVQPSAFFRQTSTIIAGVERIHPLIEGIYKPAGFVYPLSIASMLKSPYNDQVFHNPDRTWWMNYSPKGGGMDLAVNAGLVRCMTDRAPVLVLRQESDKTSAQGAQHLYWGWVSLKPSIRRLISSESVDLSGVRSKHCLASDCRKTLMN